MPLNFKIEYCRLLLLHPVTRQIFANKLQPLSPPIMERRHMHEKMYIVQLSNQKTKC